MMMMMTNVNLCNIPLLRCYMLLLVRVVVCRGGKFDSHKLMCRELNVIFTRTFLTRFSHPATRALSVSECDNFELFFFCSFAIRAL